MKKRMTEAVAILLSLAALTAFSACAGKKSGDTSGITTVATTQSATESGNVTTTALPNASSESVIDSVTSSEATLSTPSESNTSTTALQTNPSVTALQTNPSATALQSSSPATASQTKPTSNILQTASSSPTVEYFVEYKDTRLAKYFKDYDMNNVYIKMSSESKSLRATKEFGSKDGCVYSSLEDDKTKLIYLSVDRVTYLLYEKEKKYTVNALGTMSLSYVYDGCIGAGESEFDGKKCIYEAFYDNNSGNIICHLFSEKGEWLGYEEYAGTELKETNRVVAISKEIPSHLFFKVPLDYEYYYSDTIVTIPSDWND